MENRIGVIYSRESDVCASRRISLRAILAHLLVSAACVTTSAAAADESSLLISGKAVHMISTASENRNERNWGLGLQYDWDRVSDKSIPSGTVSEFRDSNRNISFYGAESALYRLQSDSALVGPGALGIVMTREDYKNNDPIPGVLPALFVGTKNVALNVAYVPKVQPQAGSLWTLQLKISLRNFP